MAGSNKRKWYVVWQGREPGVCDSWEECEARISGFPGAKYKGYPSQTAAINAFRAGDNDMGVLRAIATAPTGGSINYDAIPEIVTDSIAVDAACSGNPGRMEYRGVDVKSGIELFRVGPFEHGTNNVGEFLAIVHALALLQQQGRGNVPIYSDSRVGQLWVRGGKCKTKLTRTAANARLHDVVARAEHWLATHTYTNPILKWQTDKWGEIPADFGRK